MKYFRYLVVTLLISYIIIGCKQTPVEVSTVSLNTSTVEMVEGDTYSLVATVLPNNAEYDGISWASSNTSVASVNQGTVTALKEGKTTITANAGGKSATCSVTVSAKYIAVTSITLDKNELSLKVGSSDVLTATVKPDDATDKNVKWSSSDASIVKVDNGKVSALKSGTATITATAGSCSAECVVTTFTPVESISFENSDYSVGIGEATTLKVIIKPDSAAGTNITWSSSDESIATVDKGEIKAINEGTTTITASADGKSASCQVTVKYPDNVIYYTTTNNSKISLASEKGFGASLVSNEYENGQGKLIFDGPVTNIREKAFKDCTTLKTVRLPESVSTILELSFCGCSNLESINTPSSLVSIGWSAFARCSSLKYYEIPEGLTEINRETFANCINLQINGIPSSVTKIYPDAFINDYLDKETHFNSKLVFPEGLIEIGDYAFYGQNAIHEIVFPKSLTTIKTGVFTAIGIEKLVIPGNVKRIGSFFHCNKLVEVIVEEGAIESGSYDYCKKLKKVTLPTTVQTVNGFSECDSLTDFYIKAQTPPKGVSSYTFKETVYNDNFTIWVPMESVDTYKSADGWKEYKDKIKGYDYQ